MCAPVCGGQRLISNVFLSHFPPWFLKEDDHGTCSSLINAEGMAGQRPLGNPTDSTPPPPLLSSTGVTQWDIYTLCTQHCSWLLVWVLSSVPCAELYCLRLICCSQCNDALLKKVTVCCMTRPPRTIVSRFCQ